MEEIKETLKLILYLQQETAKDIGRLEEKIDEMVQTAIDTAELIEIK